MSYLIPVTAIKLSEVLQNRHILPYSSFPPPKSEIGHLA